MRGKAEPDARRVWRAAIGLALTTGLALPAAAADRRAYFKVPAVSATAMNVDRDACVKATLGYINGPTSPTPPLRGATSDQLVAHAFDMRGPRLAAAYEAHCMAERGYTALSLTVAERKALGRARDAAGRDRWYENLATADLATRIAAARTAAAVDR